MTTSRSQPVTRSAQPTVDQAAIEGVPSGPRGHAARVAQARASEGVADLASPLAGHAFAQHLPWPPLLAPRPSPDG